MKPGIYLELETSNPYPGLYATALMPNKDNTMIKLEGRLKFKGDAIIENNVQVKEYDYFTVKVKPSERACYMLACKHAWTIGAPPK